MLTTPLSGLNAASRQMSAISNNLANANSIGFKSSVANFGDLVAPDAAIRPEFDPGQGVATLKVQRTIHQGSLLQSSSSLDIALQGEGYFVFGDAAAASTGSGGAASGDGTANMTFSRAGKLTMAADGKVVDETGAALMGFAAIPGTSLQSPNLQSINLLSKVGGDASKIGSISVDQQGVMTVTHTDGTTPDQYYVAIARFENDGGLTAIGSTKFMESQASGTAQFNAGGKDGFGTVTQGSLEASNVDITGELLRMIEAQQAYNGNSRALQTGNEMLRSFTESVS